MSRNEKLRSKPVSTSRLSTWCNCREKARLNQLGWESTARPGLGMIFGSLTHGLLHVCMRDKLERKHAMAWHRVDYESIVKIPSVRGRIKKWRKEMLDYTGASEWAENMEILEIKARVIVPAYLRHWRKHQEKGSRVLATEYPFTGKIGAWNTHGFIDRIDAIGKENLWIVETKTKSRIAPGLIVDAGDLAAQNKFYALFLPGNEYVVSKRKLRGVIYDIIRNPGLRPAKADNTLADYAERLAEDVASRSDFYFVRFPIEYSKKAMERFAKELFVKLLEYGLWLDGTSPTYKSDEGTLCTIGGRAPCASLQACQSGRDIADSPYYRQKERKKDIWK